MKRNKWRRGFSEIGRGECHGFGSTGFYPPPLPPFGMVLTVHDFIISPVDHFGFAFNSLCDVSFVSASLRAKVVAFLQGLWMLGFTES
jgi:hypothetical protein